jgi:Zn-dependent M28 family amino/carboxypeptidase
VFVGGASVPRKVTGLSDLFGGAGPYSPEAPKIMPQVTMASEHYNRIIRMLDKGQEVELEMNIDVAWTKPVPGFNIIAEIPGTDLKDEIVMLGGHFDTWHAGTGGTDNSSGTSVCLEALRIIQESGLKPRRTIRLGLWGGEEQGLYGSREYVKEYLAAPKSEDMMAMFMGSASQDLDKKDDYEKFSVYFNNDNGTGRVRGIYMQGNEDARGVFRAWLNAADDPTAKTLTIENTSGTDHLAFDGVGLPGFQFIQDPVEYDTRTHHSNMDVYDRIQEEDVKQGAVMMAIFVYQAAVRDGMFPRKAAKPPQMRRRAASPGSN